MAGFYGNISASNRTAFTFDRVYGTRKVMDEQAGGDGVFLGRYVLVEYDNPPLTGYYNKTEDEFYSDPHYMEQDHSDALQPMDKIPYAIYQNLAELNSSHSFYVCRQRTDTNRLGYVIMEESQSGFAANYNIDVQAYGRGYDSTVWMKVIDPTNNAYRYVMVAELNTVVPKFHLVVDPPSSTPYGPYFDSSTTNLDYYMHSQANYAHRLNTQTNPERSDEKINFQIAEFDEPTHSWSVVSRFDQPGDIFYNKAGFDETISKHVDDVNNSINYQLISSGQAFYGVENAANTNAGITAPDTYLWSIHLPAIGNAIATVWDLMYTQQRRRSFLLESHENYIAGDTNTNVTIDTPSVLGLTNSMRCYMGRVYRVPQASDMTNIDVGDATLDPTKVNNPYIAFTIPGGGELGATGTGGTATFNKAVLFVDSTTTERRYYYPNFTSIWTEDPNGEYILRNGAYVLANKAAHPEGPFFKRSIGAGTTLEQQEAMPHWRYKMEYIDDGTNAQVKTAAGLAAVAADRDRVYGAPKTIQGALALINRTLGLNLDEADSRDDRTVIGMMNRMKDMVANIDTQIVPGKFIVSDTDGVITASNTDFPYAGTGNHQELLDSSGTWRLPVTYKLETLNLMNETNTSRYFDSSYYGNSCLHAVIATDTLGEAIKKMQHEMADIQYKPQEILTLTANADTAGEDYAGGVGKFIENGKDINNVVLTYTLNKGPRQSITLKRTSPAVITPIYEVLNIDPEYYVTNTAGYAASANGTHTDNNTITSIIDGTLTWELAVVDERDKRVTKTVSLKYTNKIYWGIATEQEAASFDTYAHLNGLLSGGGNKLQTSKSVTFTVNAGSGQYIYYILPKSYGTPVFTVGGFAGGFDQLEDVSFQNASGYTTTYQVWRSHRANLGSTKVVVS